MLPVLARRPSQRRIKEFFGSWLGVLIEAGLLDGDVRATSRGAQSVASDGHVCLSMGERAIEEVLIAASIPHTREDPYTDSRYRSDFRIGQTHIEYLGLAGDPTYDAKTQRKAAHATEKGLRLLLLVPRDIVDRDRLSAQLGALLDEGT